jgi:hypothetical protein
MVEHSQQDDMKCWNESETQRVKQDLKYQSFITWLQENGAIFDKVEFPCVFDKGLMGIGAK